MKIILQRLLTGILSLAMVTLGNVPMLYAHSESVELNLASVSADLEKVEAGELLERGLKNVNKNDVGEDVSREVDVLIDEPGYKCQIYFEKPTGEGKRAKLAALKQGLRELNYVPVALSTEDLHQRLNIDGARSLVLNWQDGECSAQSTTFNQKANSCVCTDENGNPCEVPEQGFWARRRAKKAAKKAAKGIASNGQLSGLSGARLSRWKRFKRAVATIATGGIAKKRRTAKDALRGWDVVSKEARKKVDYQVTSLQILDYDRRNGKLYAYPELTDFLTASHKKKKLTYLMTMLEAVRELPHCKCGEERPGDVQLLSAEEPPPPPPAPKETPAILGPQGEIDPGELEPTPAPAEPEAPAPPPAPPAEPEAPAPPPAPAEPPEEEKPVVVEKEEEPAEVCNQQECVQVDPAQYIWREIIITTTTTTTSPSIILSDNCTVGCAHTCTTYQCGHTTTCCH